MNLFQSLTSAMDIALEKDPTAGKHNFDIFLHDPFTPRVPTVEPMAYHPSGHGQVVWSGLVVTRERLFTLCQLWHSTSEYVNAS